MDVRVAAAATALAVDALLVGVFIPGRAGAAQPQQCLAGTVLDVQHQVVEDADRGSC